MLPSTDTRRAREGARFGSEGGDAGVGGRRENVALRQQRTEQQRERRQ